MKNTYDFETIRIYENIFNQEPLGSISLNELFEHPSKYQSNNGKKHSLCFSIKPIETSISNQFIFTSIVLDFDKISLKNKKAIINSLQNYDYIRYNTLSNSKEKKSFRIILKIQPIILSLEQFKSFVKGYPLWNYLFDEKSSDNNRKFVFISTFNNSKEHYYINEVNNCFKIDTDLIEQPKETKVSYNNCFNPNKLNDKKSKISEYYLSTPFTKENGNGNSNSSLFSALCSTTGMASSESLKVLTKAKQENWTSKQLNQKLDSIINISNNQSQIAMCNWLKTKV